MVDVPSAVLYTLFIAPVVTLLGHLWVAYRYAPDRAKEGTIRFFRTEDGAALFGEVIAAFMESEKGKALVADVTGRSADAVQTKLTATFTGMAGNAAKEGRKTILALLNSIDTGNPILNGAWAMIPVDVKQKIAQTLHSFLARGGLIS